MRIVYVADSIRRIGGIQRVTVAKANALAELPGNDVWILVADISGEQVYGLSPLVKVVDLTDARSRMPWMAYDRTW